MKADIAADRCELVSAMEPLLIGEGCRHRSSLTDLALDLAQTRYNLGLSSIVELSQAQLQQTQAQISSAQAGYDYRLALAVLRYQTTGI